MLVRTYTGFLWASLPIPFWWKLSEAPEISARPRHPIYTLTLNPTPKLRRIIAYLTLILAWQTTWSGAQVQVLEAPSRTSDQSIVRELIEQAEFDRAEKLIAQDLQANRNPFSAYISLGYLELIRKRVFASIRAYREAEKLQPQDGEVHRLLAVNYFLLNQKVLFHQEIQEALRANPNDPESYYLAGRFAYEVEKQFRLAADYFSKAIALSDSDYKAHCYLGLSYKALNEAADAQRELERAGQLVTFQKVKYSLPFRSLCESFLETGELDKALEYSEKAIALDPGTTENYYLLGKAELEKGSFNSALRNLHKSAALDPTYAQPYYLLGKVYMKVGQRDSAKRAFERFISLQKEYDGD